MIGKVTFQHNAADVEAVLGDDGRWACPQFSAIEPLLNSQHSLQDYSPADGAFGFRQLHAVAAQLGGHVWIEPKTPAPPGAIY